MSNSHSYTDKPKVGYTLSEVSTTDSDTNMPLQISSNKANNIINVKYIKNGFGYSVHYFYDDVEDASKTENLTATFLDEISSYTDKNIEGYKLDKVEGIVGIMGIVGIIGIVVGRI